MAQKFLTLISGAKKLLEAITSSAGAGDAGKLIALDSGGRLDESFMPVGIGADIKLLTASETLAAGDFVNVWNDSGTAKARKADATTTGKEAHGFVIAGAAEDAPATVYFEGPNTQLSSLTPGTRYYLATTAGGLTATAPSATGNVVQYLGVAVAATEVNFEPSEAVELA